MAQTKLPPSQIHNPYKFYGYLTGSQAVAGPTQTPYLIDAKVFDPNNNLNITTNKGRYTVPVDGYYQFVARARATPTGASGYVRASIAVNGTVVVNGDISRVPSAVSTSSTVTCLLYLTAGSYVEAYVDVDTATSISGTGANDNYFMGHLTSV